MISSMTGYGEASGNIFGQDYSVEIKTVNHRYLRTIIKLPEMVMFMEEHIEKLLRQYLSRGTINYVLRTRGSLNSNLLDINETTLKDMLETLDRIGRSSGVNYTCDLTGLLALPGMMTPATPSDEMTEQLTAEILALTQKALEQLTSMRKEEGRFLGIDLQSQCRQIKEELTVISERRSLVLHEYADKIRKRVDDLLAEAKLKLDEETLAREVAILAERADIAEELARLESHLSQFEQTCSAGKEPAGRRLDFIAQEMLREANTIASKSGDAEIGNRIVNIKCQIDRIKEQIQNVE
jgi:uncharacterized protein (TIGR00255 family)